MTFACKNGPIKFFKRASTDFFLSAWKGPQKKRHDITQINEFHPPGSLNVQPDTDTHYTIFPFNPKRSHSPAIDIQVRAASGDTANYLLQRENGEKNPPHHSFTADEMWPADGAAWSRGAHSRDGLFPVGLSIMRVCQPLRFSIPPRELMFQVSCEKCLKKSSTSSLKLLREI